MAFPLRDPAMEDVYGYDGQAYLDESSRLSADLAHLYALWAADTAAEIRSALANGDPWMVQAVLAYDRVHKCCFQCTLGRPCLWHPVDDAAELDPEK